MRPYIALIHKDPASDFGVSFPDLPGCVTAGVTLDEARTLAIEALSLHLEGLAADGEAAPEPSSLEDVMADIQNTDGVAILVDPPKSQGKSVRVNITLTDDLIEQIDRHAGAHGLTRSGFLARAARRALAAAE
jgi:predicted RNase H-like HicB family nuclease